VQRAINSALCQSYKPEKIIVVDDGSYDETMQVLKNYGSQIDIIKQKNGGVSNARNSGIKASTTSFIAFLDSDDEWHQDKLKLQMHYHKKNPKILFSHTNERWIRNNKEIKQKFHHKKPSGYCFNKNLSHCVIAPSTVVVHKDIFKDIGYFDESLEVCEDYDMWLRVSYRYEIGFINEILTTKYAGHENQLSFKHFAMDRFRIQSLLKYVDYSSSVKDEIIKKCDILISGAIKHNNLEIINKYEEIKSFVI
jgi:glycosyltransferase involved in cell wall biosynthesis